MKQGFRRLLAPVANFVSGLLGRAPAKASVIKTPIAPMPATPQASKSPVAKAIAAIMPSRLAPVPRIPIGFVAINTRHQRVKVMNRHGIRNGNGFHALGKRVAIARGARLRAVAVHGRRVVVEYQHPRRQGRGPEAGHGTLIFVPISQFVALPPAR